MWQRALARREQLAPGGLEVAAIVDNLGRAARARGDLVGAEVHHQQALVIREKKAVGSLSVAESLYQLGDLARVRGDAELARSRLRAALAIQERLAPGSADVASTLHALGLAHTDAGEPRPAVEALCAAVDALDAQRTRLGGTDEARSAFGLRYDEYHHDCMAALIGQDRPADAYHVLERSRARSLLQILAERDLTFSGTLPPEMARESRLTDAEYDRVQAAIAKLDPAQDHTQIETLLVRLRELRQKQEEIATRARETSPRFASLQYPQPFDLAAARNALDPGTALLAYSVGKETTVLFVVLPSALPDSGLSVIPLDVGEKALREKVAAFRNAILPRARTSRKTLTALGAELYDLLVRPAEAQIGTGARLLVSPDGPLHSLPFGALVRRAARESNVAPQYLIEWRPIHLVASATLYAEIKRSRGETPAASGLVAFGDPRYPRLAKAEGIENPEVRSVVERGLELTPLPLTRDEVEGITRLFPGTSRTYLGAEATEERAKSLGRDVRYIHFACHGFLDERLPLNSALALTIPETPSEGQDNGLLQAWEVFDHVRIDADLVTLSACKTGLGTEMGGEGLLGLTRAFLYAGARSVVGSLWAVSDRSTPLLMKRFYAHLGSGHTRDEALRAAQIDLIRSKPAAGKAWAASPSHPFHWAAFQLSGDWR
jgi:CHAT domain-containing protein